MFFGRKNNGPTIQEALGAKPIHLVKADVQPGKDGGTRLTVKLKPNKMSRWVFRLPDGASKTFEFDSLGMTVWDACDGKTSVRQIIRRLASRYNLNEREAEVSTQVFLRTLIRKGLIGIPVHSAAAKKTSK